MPNDNDKPGSTGEGTVVPFDTVDAIRARLKAEETATPGKRVFVPEEELSDEQEVDVEPEPRSFNVELIDGKALQYEGFLVATSVFAGFADGEGIIRGLIPMNQVKFIQEVPDTDVA